MQQNPALQGFFMQTMADNMKYEDKFFGDQDQKLAQSSDDKMLAEVADSSGVDKDTDLAQLEKESGMDTIEQRFSQIKSLSSDQVKELAQISLKAAAQ